MSTSAPKLPYQTLKPNEIRLITVHAPETEDPHEPILCSLENFSLTAMKDPLDSENGARYDWGDYIALSYCWGEDAKNPSRQISIDGHVVKVTQNLEAALHSIRASRDVEKDLGSVRYWIDALCINQADNSEVKQEIFRMLDIYYQARTVFVHLGAEQEDSNLGFETLKHMAKDLAAGVDLHQKLLLRRFSATEEERRAYLAARKIAVRPYWSRAWILQELAMGAGDILVGCGNSKMPLRDLVLVSKFVNLNVEIFVLLIGADHPDIPQLFDFPANRMMSVISWTSAERGRRHARTNGSSALTYLDLRQPLLGLAQSSKAANSHDKVYGILGLMPEAIRERMLPYINYSLPVETVFTIFSEAIIEYTGDLGLIFARSFEQTMEPSWATDWRLGQNRAEYPHDWVMHGYDQFDGAYKNLRAIIDASCKTRADRGRKPDFEFGSDGTTTLLKCSGFELGTIDGLARSYHADMKLLEIDDQIQSKGKENPYGDEEAMVRALVHTIYANPLWGEPEGSSSLFHIPWLCQDTSSPFTDDGQLSWGETEQAVVADMVKHGWNSIFSDGFFTFEVIRRRLAEFCIGGKRFCEYFPRTIKQCQFPPKRMKLDMATCVGAHGQRRLITLSTGHLGLAPYLTTPQDRIYVLFGCFMPVVLRPTGREGHFKVVGECYVEGMMDGEAWALVEKGDTRVENIVLC